MNDIKVDLPLFPFDIKAKLYELQIELSEGDITQKGYEKKKTKLLENFHAYAKIKSDVKDERKSDKLSPTGALPPNNGSVEDVDAYGLGHIDDIIISHLESPNANGLGRSSSSSCGSMVEEVQSRTACNGIPNGDSLVPLNESCTPNDVLPSPRSVANRKKTKRLTRNESRYTSNIRQEAVLAALTKSKSSIPTVPIPQKRKSHLSTNLYDQIVNSATTNDSNHNKNDTCVRNIDSSSSDSEIEDESSSINTPQTSNSGGDGTETFDKKERNYFNYLNQDTRKKNMGDQITSKIAGKLIWPEICGKLKTTTLELGNQNLNDKKPHNQTANKPAARTDETETVPSYYFEDVSESLHLSPKHVTQISSFPFQPANCLVNQKYNNIFQTPPKLCEEDVNRNIVLNQCTPKNCINPFPKLSNINAPLHYGIQASYKLPTDFSNFHPSYISPFYSNPTHASSFRNKSAANNYLITNLESQEHSPSGRISVKIQQLLNTLKRPKKRALHDFFKDEDPELENISSIDPNAPKPEGMTITPIIGEPLRVQTGKPRSLEAALQRYGNSIPKSPAIMVLDSNGKPCLSLTYGKFLSRVYKISYSLLNKWRAKGDVALKPGDRVALIYPNTDPLSFACAFYGCLLSGIVPLPLDVPLSRRDASYRQIGFLLGTCNVSLALTCDTCLKALPKIFGRSPTQHSPNSGLTHYSPTSNSDYPNHQATALHESNREPSSHNSHAPTFSEISNAGSSCTIDDSNPRNGVHVIGTRGWPSLTWFSTQHTPLRPPKEWKPPPPVISGAMPLPSQTIPSLTSTSGSPLFGSPCNDKLSSAYIEYTSSIDGTVKGVMVYKSSMLNHCKALTMACNYGEGEIMICVIDFKREVGLWHGILTSVYNGMHVIYVPYSLMKINPSIWMHMITKFKATIAIVKSRDLHWGLLAQKDHTDINLSSLNLLLVADGANPWSLSSCDAFVQTFKSKGLRPEVLCTCACSSESLTISLKRPHVHMVPMPGNEIYDNRGLDKLDYGRGVLSMSALSYGLIRLDKETSLTSLTLQNVGETMPGSVMVVVEIEGDPTLCKTDQVGEICVAANATANGYWSLKGLTNAIFKVQPIDGNGHPISDKIFVRTGLYGFVSQNGLLYVCSCREGLMTVSGRRHNVDDLIATVLAVQPMKFIYRGRLAIFAIKVLRDERIVIIAEQRPDCSEEDSFLWMSRVLQAIDSIHQVGIYCLTLLPPNQLPKTPLGGIHVSETKRRFEEGSLHPANLLMCPHACVTNLPKPRERHPEVSPASQYVGNMVKGERFALAHGLTTINLLDKEENSRQHKFINETLKWRASVTPDHTLFTLLSSKAAFTTTMTCQQLHKKAEKIAFLLGEKLKLQPEDHVALVYPAGTDLIASFFGCLYINLIPIPIRPPGPLNLLTTVSTVRLIVEVSKAKLILTTSYLNKLLKSKEACNIVDSKSWPLTIETDDLPKKKPNWTSEDFVKSFISAKMKGSNVSDFILPENPLEYLQEDSTAYLDFSVSTTGTLVGVKISHSALTSLCRSQKIACELYPSRLVAICLDPYSGLGLNLWCLNSIYSGHHSLLIPPIELENHPFLWLSAIDQFKIRDAFCSYAILELCTKIITLENSLKVKSLDLSCLRNCIIVAEERPRIELTQAFSKLYSPFGLSPHSLSTTFGCRVNVALCLQGASNPSPSIVYADVRSLRNDRVILVEKGSPYSVSLMESGKLLPGVNVVIANPETRCLCADSHLGEIWVNSRHNSSGYYAIYGQQPQLVRGDLEATSFDILEDGRPTTCCNTGGLTHYLTNLDFHSTLAVGDTKTRYARTGYLGFVRRTNLKQSDGEYHDALFVVGSLEETILLRGMRFHPIDIEHTILRSHKKAIECAVFTWTNNLLVAVIELRGPELEALDLIPSVTNAVLEHHHLITGIVVIVDPGVIPINSRGEKQRMHLRDSFLNDELDPIYVAYNM